MREEKEQAKEQGLGMVEVTVAMLIFLIALLALAQSAVIAGVLNSKNRDLTRVTAMCKDKAEQLLMLNYFDEYTDTTVEPAGEPLTYPGGGLGLKVGGSVAPNAPVAGYVDYLDATGLRVPASKARFTRQWRITESGNIKTIEVTVKGDARAISYQSARTVTYKSN